MSDPNDLVAAQSGIRADQDAAAAVRHAREPTPMSSEPKLTPCGSGTLRTRRQS